MMVVAYGELWHMTEEGISCAGTLNNAAFSIPCMRLFAASRPNSAPPQTMGLVPAAYLHVITKASQTFPVPAHEYLTSCILPPGEPPNTLCAVLPNTDLHHTPQNKVRCDGIKIKNSSQEVLKSSSGTVSPEGLREGSWLYRFLR